MPRGQALKIPSQFKIKRSCAALKSLVTTESQAVPKLKKTVLKKIFQIKKMNLF